MRLAVVGLGKLGLPMAVMYASRGHEVTGIDIDHGLVEALEAGELPLHEPGVAARMRCADGRLRFSSDFEQVEHADAVFVILPTPSMQSGAFNSENVLTVVREMSPCLARRGSYFLLVVASTVMPGAMERVARELAGAGLTVGADCGLCYNPEFVQLGAVMDGMEQPDVVLIGESDPRAGELLEEFYGTICTNTPSIHRMSWCNAEIAKIALNVAVTAKICVANTVAQVCERVAGADAETVTALVGSDSRIGPKSLKPGPGFGGPCFPRDALALAALAASHSVDATIPLAISRFNRSHNDRMIEGVAKLAPGPGSEVAVLGLSYKPLTGVVEESAAFFMAQQLASGGLSVRAYDPLARPAAGDIRVCDSIDECLHGADLCILATPEADAFACGVSNTASLSPVKPKTMGSPTAYPSSSASSTSFSISSSRRAA